MTIYIYFHTMRESELSDKVVEIHVSYRIWPIYLQLYFLEKQIIQIQYNLTEIQLLCLLLFYGVNQPKFTNIKLSVVKKIISFLIIIILSFFRNWQLAVASYNFGSSVIENWNIEALICDLWLCVCYCKDAFLIYRLPYSISDS